MQDLSIGSSSVSGRGVFAEKDFKIGEVLEISPVIALSKEDSLTLDKTELQNYQFEWENEEDGAIILGYGSLFNHSYDANARYELDYANKTVIFTAVKPIKKGDEIFINYNCEPDDKTKVWCAP